MRFGLENIRDLAELVKKLAVGLNRLDFNNFEGFEVNVSISSGLELEIRNQLKFIPSKYIIVKQKGNGLITSETAFTSNFLYLTNNGPSDVEATVIFLR